MIKFKKRNVLITLFLVLVMVFGIAGCNSGNDLQSKIDGLQSRIEELEEQIRERDERIEQLEEEIMEKTEGTFYTLQEAYDNGYLTKADLEAVVIERENPSSKLPELALQRAILKNYLKLYKEIVPDYPDATIDDIHIWQYYGDYNGSIVIQITDPHSLYPGEILKYIVADIVIEYSGPDILVWKYN